jgi:hypothetical protein
VSACAQTHHRVKFSLRKIATAFFRDLLPLHRGGLLHLRHQTQGVLSVNFQNVVPAIAFLEQSSRQVGPLIDPSKPSGTQETPVEIAA